LLEKKKKNAFSPKKSVKASQRNLEKRFPNPPLREVLNPFCAPAFFKSGQVLVCKGIPKERRWQS